MLRNVALRGTDRIDDFLNAGFLVANHAKDLQAERMGNGLEGARRHLDMLLLFDQVEAWLVQNNKTSLSANGPL